MSQPRFLVGSLVVLAMAIGACGGGEDKGAGGERFEDERSADLAPTENPASAPAFRDDFENPSSGWNVDDGDQFSTAYDSGRFRVVAKLPNLFGVSTTIHEGPRTRLDLQSLREVGVEVTAARQSAADGAAGVVCRAQGRSDRLGYYAGSVGADGTWTIVRSEQLQRTTIASGAGAPPLGAAPVRIRLECAGAAGQPAAVRLFVEERLVGQAEDPTALGAGGAGFVVASRGVPGVVVFLDDFAITGL